MPVPVPDVVEHKEPPQINNFGPNRPLGVLSPDPKGFGELVEP